MDTIILRLSIATYLHELNADSKLYWRRIDGAGHMQASGSTSLANAQQLVDENRCVFLIPVTDVYLTQLELKTNSKKQLYKAIPYALEDDLAEDIEQLHFAINTYSSTDQKSVMVIKQSLMSNLIDILDQHGLVPEIISADIFDLTWTDSTAWSCLIEDDHALVRTALDNGFSCPLNDLHTYIELTLRHTPNPPDKITTLCTDNNVNIGAEIAAITVEKSNYGLFNPLLENNTINLLQHSFARQNNSLSNYKTWLPTVALIAVLSVLLITVNAVEVVRLNSLDKRLKQQIESVFKQAFPEVRNIVNPRVQMEQRLTALNAQNDNKQRSQFLKLLHDSATVIKDHEGTDIMNIQFRQTKLTLDIHVPTIQILEKIKAGIQDKQVNVQVQTARNVDKRIEARISIEE